MSLRNVRIIALKELRDVLRDRRTLIFMMLLPVAVMPLLMYGGARFVAKQQQAKQERRVVLAADAATQNTLVALGKQWVAENPGKWRAWQRLQLLSQEGAPELVGQAGRALGRAAETVGRVAEGMGLGSKSAAADDVEADGDAPEPTRDELVADGALDGRAVDRLLSLTDFVRPEELVAAGTLQEGLSIPAGAPEALRDERLAIALQAKEIHAAVHLPPDALSRLETAEEHLDLPVFFDSSQSMSEEAGDRIDAFVRVLNEAQLDTRLADAGLPASFAEPMRTREYNLATRSRRLQAAIGGFLPYMLLAFCFFGALYPALDVTAGEKERFTLETLLLAPATRFEIACGKFVVVFLAGIVAALLATASMVVTLTYLAESLLPPGTLEALDIHFQPLALVLTGSLILPVAAMYAAALLAIGVYARSFKEAQSYTVPLQFLFVLPSMVALIPDVETQKSLAWIPFVNISLLVRELFKGNYLWGFYGITLVSTLLLTLLALGVAARLFRREAVLLRT